MAATVVAKVLGLNIGAQDYLKNGMYFAAGDTFARAFSFFREVDSIILGISYLFCLFCTLFALFYRYISSSRCVSSSSLLICYPLADIPFANLFSPCSTIALAVVTF